MGNHSAVYFGICPDETHGEIAMFKIGETTATANARMSQQRYSNRPDFDIVRYHERFENPYSTAERVFIEGYVRMRFSQLEGIYLNGKDFFNYNVKQYREEFLCRLFNQWVTEGERIVDHLPTEEFVKKGRPIAPAGYEQLFETILKEIDEKGYSMWNIQMNSQDADRYLHMLKTAFTPCGFICSTHRNYSWVYFKVEKTYL